MLNGGLTIYPEFIDAVSLLAHARVLCGNVAARNCLTGNHDKYDHRQI
jgi:hypothetical protein